METAVERLESLAANMQSSVNNMRFFAAYQQQRMHELRDEVELYDSDAPHRYVLQQRIRDILTGAVAIRRRVSKLEDEILHVRLAAKLHVFHRHHGAPSRPQHALSDSETGPSKLSELDRRETAL